MVRFQVSSLIRVHGQLLSYLLAEIETGQRILPRRRGLSAAPRRLVDPQQIVLQTIIERTLLLKARVQVFQFSRDGAMRGEELLVRDLLSARGQRSRVYQAKKRLH